MTMFNWLVHAFYLLDISLWAESVSSTCKSVQELLYILNTVQYRKIVIVVEVMNIH